MGRLFSRRRIHPIAQMERAECGAACLAMLLEAFGCRVPLSQVRLACGVGRDGTSAGALLRAACAYGVSLRAVRCELDNLRDLPTPAILHWQFSHFVVLESAHRRGAMVVDPKCGRRRVATSELDRSFTGIALIPADEPKPLPERAHARSSVLRPYLRLLLAHRKAVALLVVSALCLEIFALTLPASQRILLDEIIRPGRGSWLGVLASALVVLTAARLSLGFVRLWVTKRLQFRLDTQITERFAAHLFALPQTFFIARSPGDLAERVHQVGEIRELAQNVLKGALDLLLVVGFSALVAIHDLRTGLVLVLLNALRLLIVRTMSRSLEQRYLEQSIAQGKEAGIVVEAARGTEMVRALGLERYYEQAYANRTAATANASLASDAATDRIDGLSSVLDAVTLSAVVWTAGSATMHGQMSLGAFAAILSAAGLVRAPLDSAAAVVSRLYQARGFYSRLQDVLLEPREPSGKVRLESMRGQVQLDSVHVAYGAGARPVCADLNLKVEAGEKLAIVGPSGAGKSTLLRLLLGLLEPSSGRVVVDGVDLRDVDRNWYRSQVGSVLQDQFTINDSVLENTRLRVPNASAQTARQALDLVGMPHRKRPRSSHRLSGGERQRLALAAAFCEAPNLLVLDEPTSALDAASERVIQRALRESGRTVVFVTHRLEMLDMASRVAMMEGGRIVELGPVQQLLRHDGPFRRLFARGAGA